MSINGLSARGAKAANSPARVDLELYFEAAQNLYNRETNPEGAFPLNVAENKLNWPALQDKIAQITRKEKVADWASRYGNPAGVDSFREAVADYLAEYLFGCPVAGETLAFSSGLTSTIEQTAFVVAEPGDVAVIPAPSYPVYTGDLGVKSGVKRYDLQTHHDISELQDGLPLQIADLEKAQEEITNRGERFRILILTTPDNPTGGIYSQEQLESIAKWCIDHEVHLIVNEIYGISRIDTSHPAIREDYSSPTDFQSFGPMMAELKSPYLHLWYSFSKDFGISGFRIGLIHSHNADLIRAYGNVNLTHSVSNLTQWLMERVLHDQDFVKSYLAENQKRLTEAYAVVATALKKMHTPYNPSRGSLFIWMDLSELLAEPTSEAEEALWLEIYHSTGILLTPPHGFGHTKKGLYRMVISYFQPEDIQVAMDRLSGFVKGRRK